MNIDLTFIVSDQRLFRSVECQTFTFRTSTQLSNIVQTKNHILCRHSNRRTVCRVQDIMWLKHQHLCFQNCFITQRQVNSHLVTVKVGIECRTCQRVQLNSFTFDHLRLESLNTQTVQCRSTVQQYRMSFHYMFQNIPDHRFLAVNDLLGRLNSLNDTTFDELTNNKRLVQFGSHQFRNTAFTHSQFRTYDDYRTSRVVNTFTQQVLTETSLFTFQAVRQWLQRAVGICLHSTWLTWVIKQRIDRFLKHTFFITQNHFRSLDFNQSFQTVITDNHTTIKVVQVRCSKTTTIQRNQRTKFGWDNRYDTYNHPFRFVASTWCTERFYYLKTFQSLILTLLWSIVTCTVTQFVRQSIQVQTSQQIIDSFSTHLSDEFVWIIILKILIVFRKRIQNIQIFFFRKQIIFGYAIFSFHTRLNNNITFVVYNRIQLLRR